MNKVVKGIVSFALLVSSTQVLSYIGPEEIDKLIAMHEESCTVFSNGWAAEAGQELGLEGQSLAHRLNILVAICKIDQSRKAGSWDDFFAHVGGSHKKIGRAIDLSIHCLDYWGDSAASEIFHGYIIDNALATHASQQWSAFAGRIEKIQLDRAEAARLEEEARLEAEQLAEEQADAESLEEVVEEV